MLRTTPIGPLVKEAGLRSADSLLANRRRRYTTRAFELAEGNPISDGIRNPVDDVSLFGRLSKCCRQDIQPQLSGQDMVESTYIPTSTERIAAPVIIESRQQAEHTALSMSKARTKCIWTDGSRDDLGNVGAAVAWNEVDEWTVLKYRLGRNKEVFDAELFAILQATVLIRDEGAIMIGEGIQKISIFTDSQAALNRIQDNGIGPGQTWASAIIRNTDEIRRQNIQGEVRWVPGHAGIEGNETADKFAKDAAEPEIEEELPSAEDRCTSLSHLRRSTMPFSDIPCSLNTRPYTVALTDALSESIIRFISFFDTNEETPGYLAPSRIFSKFIYGQL
jgi:ribonuclease HI